MVPEAVIAMLACARMGAGTFGGIFGGFAAHAELAIRINDARPKLILCVQWGKEIQKSFPNPLWMPPSMKPILSHKIAWFFSEFVKCDMNPGYDLDWETLRSAAQPAACVPVEAWHPLYILYTSGTTSPTQRHR